VYADNSYNGFSKALKQLSSWQPWVGSEGFDDVELGLGVVDVVLGVYVAIKQGHADEMDEMTLVGPQLAK